MTLEEIKLLHEQDRKIDPTQLDVEALKIASLHGKYLNIFTDEKMLYRKYNIEYTKLRKFKWEYYSGKSSQEDLELHKKEPFGTKVLRQDLDVYLDSDEELQNSYTKVELQKIKLEYLEGILKELNSRNWSLRAAIDWRKFTNGVN